MTTWGDKLQAISQARLDQLAVSEFDLKVVYAACRERAAAGHLWADIRPSVPVNVQECEAVKALIGVLKKEKVRVEWVPVQDGPDIRYNVLRISWEKRS